VLSPYLTRVAVRGDQDTRVVDNRCHADRRSAA
jgi:hypothetical protein